jgi:hypothetical protein
VRHAGDVADLLMTTSHRSVLQTDLDPFYVKYPGLKKLVTKGLKQYANSKTYFKTRPSDNRAEFGAVFSNNATNGKV